MTQGTLSAWETGRYELPDTSTLMKIGKALGVTVDELLAGVDHDYDVTRRKAQLVDALRAFEEAFEREAAKVGADKAAHTVAALDLAEARKATRIALNTGAPAFNRAWFAIENGRHRIGQMAEAPAGPLPPDVRGEGSIELVDEGQSADEAAGETAPRPPDVTHPDAYAVLVRSDGMVPVFRPGAVLVVTPGEPRDGAPAYVQLASGERLVRTLRRTAGGWILEAANPSFGPRYVTDEDLVAVHPVRWARLPDPEPRS